MDKMKRRDKDGNRREMEAEINTAWHERKRMKEKKEEKKLRREREKRIKTKQGKEGLCGRKKNEVGRKRCLKR